MPSTQTNQQIYQNLTTDGEYAINFIIDNNPLAVAENLTAYGVELPANPSNASIRQTLDQLMITAPESDVMDILDVPYLEDAPNYTGGMSETIDCPDPTQPCQRLAPIIVAAIIGAVATTGAVVANSIRSKKEREAAAQLAAQEAALQQQLIDAQEQRGGMNKTTLYVLAGLMVLVGIVVVIAKRK
jgi:hypothetical protein